MSAISAANIQERLQPLMRNLFDADELVIQRDLTANDVDGWDSLAHVHLIVAVEKEFSIRMSTNEIAKLKSVGDLIDTIASKVSS